jgi:hypothetical protein
MIITEVCNLLFRHGGQLEIMKTIAIKQIGNYVKGEYLWLLKPTWSFLLPLVPRIKMI